MDTKRHQQGDVNMFEVDNLPDGLKKVDPQEGRYILAEGESTGHCHAIAESEEVEMFSADDKSLWLLVKEVPVTVRHEEHGTITLPKGKYRVGIVREVDPFSEEIHKVRD